MTAIRNAMSTAKLQQGFVSGVILIVALIGFGMVRYPLIVSEAGLSSVFLPAFMLLLYGVAAVWFTHRPGQAHTAALRTGTAYGLVIGVTFIVTISVENFVDIIGQVGTISTLGFMLLIFLLFALSGWRGAKDSGQLRLGIFASVRGAMIGVLIALLFGFAINFLFALRLEQNLQASAEYVRSSSHTPPNTGPSRQRLPSC